MYIFVNWDYMAGLFDGEGSITLTHPSKYQVEPHIRIASSSPSFRKEIIKFFTGENIRTSETIISVAIENWEGCEKFIKELDGKLVEKQKKAELFKKVYCFVKL